RLRPARATIGDSSECHDPCGFRARWHSVKYFSSEIFNVIRMRFSSTLTKMCEQIQLPPTSNSDQSETVIETSKSNDVLLQTDIPQLELYASGKVRDIYKVDANHLLFVATDRISAFDYVLATGIPQKGRVLTQLSLFWFEFLKDIVAN